MTSKETQDFHKETIEKILLESGIRCERLEAESTWEEIAEEEEEPTKIEETAEVKLEEVETEAADVAEEEESVQVQHSFPTPSLRRVLPERLRKLEPFNQMHVLPEVFKSVTDPELIPNISMTRPTEYIDILAEIVGCTMYRNNLAEYWFLDTLAEILRRAQADLLDKNAQAVLILWFCEWMKEIQYFDAADRERMMRRFEEIMLAAAGYVGDEYKVPAPEEIGVYHKQIDTTKLPITPINAGSTENLTFEGAYQCSMDELSKILQYIFDLSDYQFDLVRSIFCQTPQYKLIDAPYQIQLPKSLYAPPKDKGKKGPRKDKPQKKGKKAIEVLPEDYIFLMELKAKEEKELMEKEELERVEWMRKCSILPLNLATDTQPVFDKHWPPTPPPEVKTPKPQQKPPKKGK